jgi:threonylcarbamoyladenosine tRNA methylthiotransferase MtaB
MKISFYNIGCKVNYADVSELQEMLEALGHSTVPFGAQSDAVFINTCTVTNNADADARKVIRKAIRNSPDAYVGVLGCYAQLKPDEVAKIKGVDAVFGQNEKFKIPQLIDNFSKNDQTQVLVSGMEDIPFHTSCSAENDDRTRVFLKIQDGCDYVCTYCTIPMARGGNRSMDFAELQTYFNSLENEDFYEIIISGINVGEYKAKTSEDFSDVVKFIDSAGVKQRIRISSIEPNKLKPEIIEMISKSGTFCPHFHIPLQSGSDDILKAMKRRYNSGFYRGLIENINYKIDDVCIGIDVIVGFPGESDEKFQETYDFLESLQFSYLHVFTYSERDNTPAAEYAEVVPHIVRKERTKQLRQLSDKKRDEFYTSQLGSIRTVIPEQFKESPKDGKSDDYSHIMGEPQLNNPIQIAGVPMQEVAKSKTVTWSGWTENYVKVEFEAPRDLAKIPHKIELLSMDKNCVKAKLI